MKVRVLFFVLAILSAIHGYAEGSDPKTYGQIPLFFEANHGQTDSSVRFLSRGPGYGLFLGADQAVIRLVGERSATIRMKLIGGSSKAVIQGVEPAVGKTNYLTGADKDGWTAGIPTFSRVLYTGVYPGIDLAYYGNQRQLEYDFVVAPGSRPETIRMGFDGLQTIAIDPQGDLVLKTDAGEMRQPKPLIYQQDGDRRVPVDGGYVLRDRRTVGFRVGAYDKTRPLVIDPVLVYSSYFGGTSAAAVGDLANAITVDAGGNVYVTGQTSSTDLLIISAAQTTQHGQADGFVFKLDPTGTVLMYSTYFGGSGNDEGHSIAVDAAGNAYVTGFTSSDDLPTTANAFQRARTTNQEAYLLKLSPAGNGLLYSTYLGGNGDDRGLAVALDPKGGIYVTGLTGSTNFPVAGALQGTNAGGLADVFVTKFGPTGTIQYSTYVGGRGNDQSYGMAVDAAGAAYVVGYTTSGCPPRLEGAPNQAECDDKVGTFPRVSAFQSAFGGGSDDAFVFKLNPAGNAFEYSTYLGGLGSDNATRVAVNANGNAYVTGYTTSEAFPLVSPIQFIPFGGFDAFITCLAPDGKSLVFSTYFGGEGNDSGTGIALDPAGNVYVAGYTESVLLQTANAFQGANKGLRDGFVMKLDPAGSTLVYSTFLGGSGIDSIVGLAVDSSGNAYVAGLTYSVDLPVVNPFRPENAGGEDAFVAKINSSDIVTSSEFSVTSAGGAVIATSAVSSVPVFGYAVAEVPNGGAPTGLEIISLVSNDVTVTEVGILAPELSRTGRLYTEVDSNTRSVLSIANPGDEDVSVDFFFSNNLGESSNYATQVIPAHAHFSAFVTDAPFSLLNPSQGTINFTASLPVAATAFRTFNNERGDFILSPSPIGDPYKVTNQPVTIPHFADGAGWDSMIVLVNPTEEPLHGEIEFLSSAGAPLNVSVGGQDPTFAYEYEIPPRSFSRYQTPGTVTHPVTTTDPDTGLEVTVDVVDPMQSGSIRIVPFDTNTPQAHAVVSWSVANITVFQTSVEAQLPRPAMRLYAEASGTFDVENVEIGATRTAFAIANPSNQAVSVRLDLTRIDGVPTGLTTTIQIPALGQIASFIHEMPGFANLPLPFKGILQVTALNGPGVTSLGLRTLFNERFQFLATTTGPIVETAGTTNQLTFPHIAEGQGYSTEFVLIARPNGPGAAGTLRFVTQTGTPLNLTRRPD